MNDFIFPFFNGLFLALGLIIVIGVQNAFVLKQAILKNHIIIVCLICIITDAALFTLAINGFASFMASNEHLVLISNWLAIVFLLLYSFYSFYCVFRLKNLQTSVASVMGLKKIICHTLAISLLNPHAYLDSFIIIGGASVYLPTKAKIYFTLGAICASCIWFSTLAFFAVKLQKFFNNAFTWKILDFIIGCVMLVIAIVLISARL